MVVDVSGLSFFMPVFSFLFVFIVIYAILAKTNILGGNQFVNLLVSFIMSIVFMSFSSFELYVRTLMPLFVVLLVVVFLVLLIAGFSAGSLDKIMSTKVAWFIAAILIVIFLIAAIKVFNPVLHPDLIITEGGDGPGIVSQLKNILSTSSVAGSILLLIVAVLVSWFITRK